MNGKSKCKILKDIRRQIAAENDIAYVTSECKYQGDCTGTCPKCEQEVRYLEEQLRQRRKAGKAVAVAGIAAALVVTSAGCELLNNREPDVLEGDVTVITEPATEAPLAGDIPLETEPELEGRLASTEPDILMGEPTETVPVLMGEVPALTE